MLHLPTLEVHVVWHPRCQAAERYAHALFGHLFEDPDDLASHGLRIPVRMWRSQPDQDHPPAPQIPPLHEAKRCAVVVIVDEEFVSTDAWVTFLAELMTNLRAVDIVIPATLSATVFEVPSPIWRRNAARLHDYDEDLRQQVLLNRVTHALCRLLAGNDEPVTVFLSHAKADGVKITADVRTFLESGTGVRNFFDAQDLTEGSKWEERIRTSAEETVLLAVRTDAYATREWCRTEVLEAKRAGAPVIVLDALEDRETRGFAYLGNTPSVRWRMGASRASMEDLLGVILQETLRFRYFPVRVADLCHAYGIPGQPRVLPAPPELLTVLRGRTANGSASQRLVYPDPPLGTDELALLTELEPNLDPITPNTLIAGR